ncbi:hypothetical protein WJX77_007823 [Trebouxia sp. C0004]
MALGPFKILIAKGRSGPRAWACCLLLVTQGHWPRSRSASSYTSPRSTLACLNELLAPGYGGVGWIEELAKRNAEHL